MEAVMDRSVIKEIIARFQALSSIVPLNIIKNAKQYDKAVAVLNQLLDAGAANERSPLADLANSLGSLVGEYEDAHQVKDDVSPISALRFLMAQHWLTQSDLPEVGSQGVVSELLRGNRELNIRQIKALSHRFHVPAGLFI